MHVFHALDYFYKTWVEYKAGFGTPGEEHWLGLEAIYALTQATDFKLRIRIELLSGTVGVATYDTFKLTENVSKSSKEKRATWRGSNSRTPEGETVIGHFLATGHFTNGQ